MKKIYMLLIASVFACNILGAAAVDYKPLFEAIKIKDTKAVESFFRDHKDIDINCKDDKGWTPLLSASLQEDTELACLFLDKNADVNVAESYGYTPLHMAVCKENEDMVKLLLEYKAKTDRRTRFAKQTAAEMARESRCNNIAELIESGYPNDGTEIKEPEGE